MTQVLHNVPLFVFYLSIPFDLYLYSEPYIVPSHLFESVMMRIHIRERKYNQRISYVILIVRDKLVPEEINELPSSM